ncbi:MAG: M48 family metallopeptidase [Planctomycetota bacterium]
MDFFEQQDLARRKTGRLLVLFALAVLAIIATTYCLVAGVMLASQSPSAAGDLLDWPLLLLVGLGTVAVVGGGSAYKLKALAAGGPAVAEHLGGKLLHGGNTDAAGRRLLNIVDEMAIASGVPAPQVYLLPDEEGVNAFAAGRSVDDAVIGVTRGAVRHLSRDELQGVVAHEFSHILNGDMRLNLRLMALLHGILVIGLAGQMLLRSLRFMRLSRNRRQGGGGVAAIVALGVGLMVVGFAGVFFGNLIKAAVSRQREFLADASAVQFTRLPEGIAGALKRIGALSFGSRLRHPNAPEASHMFIAEALPRFSRLFATHPPLEERIRRLDPGWDGSWPELAPEVVAQHLARAGPGRKAFIAPQDVPLSVLAGSALEQAGHPAQAHVDRARVLIASLPPQLAQALATPYGARAAVLALLLSSLPELRRKQFALLQMRPAGTPEAMFEQVLLKELQNLEASVARLDLALRLPVIELALPALRALSPTQAERYLQLAGQFIDIDQDVSLFEWMLRRQLRQHLLGARSGRAAGRSPVLVDSLGSVRGAVRTVMAALVHAAGDTENTSGAGRAASLRAAEAAAEQLGLGDLSLVATGDFAAAELDLALERLALLKPGPKGELLAACAACVSADRVVTTSEAELLRTLADALGVPVPPVLPGQRLAPSL